MANQKPKPKVPSASSQAYLDIEEVKEGVVILKNGSMRAVIMVSSINFALKSEEERDSIVVSFQSFLNSLNFPIQIISHSRKIDLDDYIRTLKDLENNSNNNPLLKIQIGEYAGFVQGLLDEVNIMDKLFFVVVPFYPNVLQKTGFLSGLTGGKQKNPETNFEADKLKIMDRVDIIVNGLKSIGLSCISLDTQNLIELYYSLYNPESFQRQKIKESEDLTADIVRKGKEPEHLEI